MSNYGGWGNQGDYSAAFPTNTNYSLQYQGSGGGNPSGGNWWSNWGQDALGGLLSGWQAYNAYDMAKDQRNLAQQANQPQTTNQVSGWNLGDLGPMWEYFAGEIPNIYNWTAQQYAGMGRGGGPRGAGGLSSSLARDMADYARANDPMVDAGKNYLTNTVSGQTMNPYLDAAFQHAMGGPLASMIGGGSGVGFGGGGGAAQVGPSAHQQYLTNWYQNILNDPLNNDLSQSILDSQGAQITDQYNDAVAAANRNAELTGNFGGSARVNQQGINAGNFARALGDSRANLGAAMLDRGLAGSGQVTGMQTNLDAQNAATNRANADLARAYDSMRMQGALGQLGFMGDMAGLMSLDQRSAAGMIPGYHDIQMSDLERAFGANMRLDQMNNQAAHQRAANQMQMAQMPWNNLQSAMSLLQIPTGYLGTQFGDTTRPGAFMPMPNPMMTGIGAGMNTWGDYQNLFGGGNG